MGSLPANRNSDGQRKPFLVVSGSFHVRKTDLSITYDTSLVVLWYIYLRTDRVEFPFPAGAGITKMQSTFLGGHRRTQ